MDKDIVNIANMRHLFILPKPIVGWRRGSADEETQQASEQVLIGEPATPPKESTCQTSHSQQPYQRSQHHASSKRQI
jgi:hypothetical protein